MIAPLFMRCDKKFLPITLGKPVEKLPNLAMVFGKKGTYTFRNNVAYTTLAKAEFEFLDDLKEKTVYCFPEISFDIYQKSLEFFRQILETHGGEACVLLTLDRKSKVSLSKQQYKIVIPKQVVSGGSVKYEVEEGQIDNENGEFLAGSIHSHPTFSASQSSTDSADEFKFDGIHVTLGHIKRQNPEVHQRVVVGDSNFVILSSEPPMIFITPPVEKTTIPDEWLQKVEKESPINYRTVYDEAYENWEQQQLAGIKYGNTTSLPLNTRSLVSVSSIAMKKIWDLMRPEVVNAPQTKDLEPVAMGFACGAGSL